MAVLLRRHVDRSGYGDRLVYRIMGENGLLQKRKRRTAELQQARGLFELLPSAPNQLWQMDVTYLLMPQQGVWWFVVTVIDYYSRYLLACHLTPFQNAIAVTSGLNIAVEEATRLHGTPTEMPRLVTDNGSVFISRQFQESIADEFEHFRTRYRTPEQLGLLERFHATLKREEIHWNTYEGPDDARTKLKEFQDRYNNIRPHWALRPGPNEDPYTPSDVYVQGLVPIIPKWQPWARAARKILMESMPDHYLQDGENGS